MAKDIVHETMHEMLAFDLLMDAGGDIDKLWRGSRRSC